MPTIGENMRRARRLAGLSQEELARRSGISVMSIRRYESDTRIPTLETLGTLAKAMNSYVGNILEPGQWGQLDADWEEKEDDIDHEFRALFADMTEDQREEVKQFAAFVCQRDARKQAQTPPADQDPAGQE